MTAPALQGGQPLVIVIPRFQLGRGENNRELPFMRAKRVKTERGRVIWAWLQAEMKGQLHLPPPPWHITLFRCSPRDGLDFVNMCGSLKAVQDQVAAQLKLRDDRDATGDEVNRAKWEFKEDTRVPWAVRIEIRTRGAQPSPESAR